MPGTPGVVDQIRARIKGKVRQGGAVRIGYRIYRDSSAGGKTGVEDQGLPLSDNCGSSNEEEFINSFKSVEAKDTPQDTDYAEKICSAGWFRLVATLQVVPTTSKSS